MRLSEIITYYSRQDISKEMIRISPNREVAVRYGEQFGKRPDILQFPDDIKKQAHNGATSFHCSEEKWLNPLDINSELSKDGLDRLRVGFDLVLDIDCKILKWSTICARILINYMKHLGIKAISLKFSGGTGWHIGLPHEALGLTATSFPETPQIVARYLKTLVKKDLAEAILISEGDIKNIVEKSNKKREELFEGNEFNPFSVLEIDTILISSRHLFRMPYSLNEKTWLVSLPINEKDLENFNTASAKPELVKVTGVRFLDNENVNVGEASQLVIEAWDWWHRQESEKKGGKVEEKNIVEYENKVPEDKFPPCIKLILKGMTDGKKRALFALINFLSNAKWTPIEIEQKVYEWNKINPKPLKEGYIKAQISYYTRQTTTYPPPNCREYYEDLGVCKPDEICQRIKNPLTYPRFSLKRSSGK